MIIYAPGIANPTRMYLRDVRTPHVASELGKDPRIVTGLGTVNMLRNSHPKTVVVPADTFTSEEMKDLGLEQEYLNARSDLFLVAENIAQRDANWLAPIEPVSESDLSKMERTAHLVLMTLTEFLGRFTVVDLHSLARVVKIKGQSKMRRLDLESAILDEYFFAGEIRSGAGNTVLFTKFEWMEYYRDQDREGILRDAFL